MASSMPTRSANDFGADKSARKSNRLSSGAAPLVSIERLRKFLRLIRNVSLATTPGFCLTRTTSTSIRRSAPQRIMQANPTGVNIHYRVCEYMNHYGSSRDRGACQCPRIQRVGAVAGGASARRVSGRTQLHCSSAATARHGSPSRPASPGSPTGPAKPGAPPPTG